MFKQQEVAVCLEFPPLEFTFIEVLTKEASSAVVITMTTLKIITTLLIDIPNYSLHFRGMHFFAQVFQPQMLKLKHKMRMRYCFKSLPLRKWNVEAYFFIFIIISFINLFFPCSCLNQPNLCVSSHELLLELVKPKFCLFGLIQHVAMLVFFQ